MTPGGATRNGNPKQTPTKAPTREKVTVSPIAMLDMLREAKTTDEQTFVLANFSVSSGTMLTVDGQEEEGDDERRSSCSSTLDSRGPSLGWQRHPPAPRNKGHVTGAGGIQTDGGCRLPDLACDDLPGPETTPHDDRSPRGWSQHGIARGHAAALARRIGDGRDRPPDDARDANDDGCRNYSRDDFRSDRHSYRSGTADHPPKRQRMKRTCKFWRRGDCRRGTGCEFAHDDMDRGGDPPRRC